VIAAGTVADVRRVRLGAIGRPLKRDTVCDVQVHDRRTEPGVSSTAYTGTIAVSDTRSVKARAYKTGWTPSDSAVASYWISAGTVATPTIAPAAGTFISAPLVTLACTTSGGGDDSVHARWSRTTEGSPRYQFPFLIEASATLESPRI